MVSFCVPKQLQIEMYWSMLREVYTSYQEQHSPIMSHYHSLREKDDFYQKEIARNDAQIQLATVRYFGELISYSTIAQIFFIYYTNQ